MSEGVKTESEHSVSVAESPRLAPKVSTPSLRLRISASPRASSGLHQDQEEEPTPDGIHGKSSSNIARVKRLRPTKSIHGVTPAIFNAAMGTGFKRMHYSRIWLMACGGAGVLVGLVFFGRWILQKSF